MRRRYDLVLMDITWGPKCGHGSNFALWFNTDIALNLGHRIYTGSSGFIHA